MAHRSNALTLLLLLASLGAGCGDPLIIVGDTPGFMRVVAGVGDQPGTTIAPQATETLLTQPLGMSFDASLGRLLIADRGVTLTEGGISTRGMRLFSVASDGSLSAIFTDGGCTRGACIREPVQMVTTPDGALLVADLAGARLLRISPDRVTITVLAGTGVVGDAADGTPAVQSQLRGVGGVAVGSAGQIYFSETGGHRIRTIAADGTLQTVAGNGTDGYAGDGGPGLQARLSAPRGLAHAGGVLYIADSGNHLVRTLDLGTSTMATLAGTPRVPGFIGDGGTARGARMNQPVSVTVTPDGQSLYVADLNNGRVRAIALGGGTISTFAGTGTPDFGGTGTAAGATPLRAPMAVEAGEFGFLFISDAGQHVVWRTSVRLQL